jgi:hypothetical protein
LQGAAADGNIDEPFLTGSVMSDVNGERSHTDTRTLDALLNLVDTSSDSDSHVDNVPGGEDDHEDDFAADMDEPFLEDNEQHDSTSEQALPESRPLDDVGPAMLDFIGTAVLFEKHGDNQYFCLQVWHYVGTKGDNKNKHVMGPSSAEMHMEEYEAATSWVFYVLPSP